MDKYLRIEALFDIVDELGNSTSFMVHGFPVDELRALGSDWHVMENETNGRKYLTASKRGITLFSDEVEEVEETPTEVTLEEVAEKFGVPVASIRVKE